MAGEKQTIEIELNNDHVTFMRIMKDDYNIPLRASNANASNAPHEQSVYESQMSLWACLLGEVNFILHGHGWLEGGLWVVFLRHRLKLI